MKPTYEQLEQQLAAVVEENARCKFEISRCHQTVDEMFKHREKWIDKEWLSSIWSTSNRLMNETPATDAAIANLRAQGVDEIAELYFTLAAHEANGSIADSWRESARFARDHAAQLRQGAEHE